MARSAPWRVNRSPSNTTSGPTWRPIWPGATLHVQKCHSFAPVGVRPGYPGPHAITVQVNGVELGAVAFEVTPAVAS